MVGFSDGSEAIAHYYVLPPLHEQIAAVTTHWSTVAWVPREFDDPFGRGASVMPWDREDGRHRFNDGRAYDVGLSDDAGGGNPLGFASAVAYSPTQAAVTVLDEYIEIDLSIFIDALASRGSSNSTRLPLGASTARAPDVLA